MKYRIVKLKKGGYSPQMLSFTGYWVTISIPCITKWGAKRQILKDVKESKKEDKVIKEFEF